MKTWSSEDVEKTLHEKGWYRDKRPIQDGVQYILIDDTPVNWYKTGKVVVRGKTTAIQQEAESIFRGEGGAARTDTIKDSVPTSVETPPTRVFIVYGHDVKAREELELILRRLRLEPIVLQNLPGTGDTIIEKLEVLTKADFACVLLTPDDEGHPCGCLKEKKPRARQNVVLELGMVLARLGRRRVAILVKGKELERPSDINGLIYIPFQDRVEEAKNALAANLQKAGFSIQVEDLLP